MGVTGFLLDSAKILRIGKPIDIDTGTGGFTETGANQSPYISLGKFDRVTFIISIGVSSNNSAVTLVQSDDASGSNTEVLGFENMWAITGIAADNNDVTDAYTKTAVGSDTFNTAAESIYIIDVRGEQLEDDRAYVRLNMTDPGESLIASVIAIVHEATYPGATEVSSLT